MGAVESIRARLLNGARHRGEDFNLTLERYAGERFLYRLGQSDARERCVLKGATLLAVWLPDPYRATRDVDLLGYGIDGEAGARVLIEEICALPCPDDGITFDLTGLRIDTIRSEDEYNGVRARFRASLGSARITMQIDIGVGDAVGVPTEEVEVPALLDTVPAPHVRAYPREATIAEKFEAMVSLGTRNSRMKDFHDIWALSESFAFRGETLAEAVAACFERRETALGSPHPAVLTEAFYERPGAIARWMAYRSATGVLQPPPAEFSAVGARIRAFLGPLQRSVAGGERPDSQWPPSGPWRTPDNDAEPN